MSEHDLCLPWRTDDPYPDVINDSNGEEVASVCNDDDCAFIVKAVNNHDALVKALTRILDANYDFRNGMPDDWEGDPLQDACNEARDLLQTILVGGPSR